MRFFILPLSFLLQFSSCAQTDSSSSAIEPVVNSFKHQLGNRSIEIKVSQYEPADNIFLLQLHDNEETAERVAREYLSANGGTLLNIENGGNRNILFSQSGKRYEFDPNRIFTSKGIKETLDLFGSHHRQAEVSIKDFASILLEQLPEAATIVALHNNTDKRYSLNSFKTEKDLRKSVHSIHHNTAMDEDDFFITTDSLLYQGLKDKNYSVVLQNNATVPDDGSLSVYLGREGRSYVNIEAEYGHLQQQSDMLHILVQLLKTPKN